MKQSAFAMLGGLLKKRRKQPSQPDSNEFTEPDSCASSTDAYDDDFICLYLGNKETIASAGGSRVHAKPKSGEE